jgi:hypothetical protein
MGTVMTVTRGQQDRKGARRTPTLSLVSGVTERGHEGREEVGDGSCAGDEAVQEQKALRRV